MGAIIGLYAAVAGGTNNGIAAIDCPRDGAIVGVSWDLRVDLDADAETAQYELGFGSVQTLAVNDTRSRISSVSAGFLLVGALGTAVIVANYYVPIPSVAIGMGERLYLHELASAGVGGVVRCNVHFDFDLDQPKVRRR